MHIPLGRVARTSSHETFSCAPMDDLRTNIARLPLGILRARLRSDSYGLLILRLGVILLGAAALPNLPAELVVAALFPVCFLALGAAVARLAAAALLGSGRWERGSACRALGEDHCSATCGGRAGGALVFPKAGSVDEAALSCVDAAHFLGSTSTVRPSATPREVEASESAARGVQEQAKSRLRCEPERNLNENFDGTRGCSPATRAEAWTGARHLVRLGNPNSSLGAARSPGWLWASLSPLHGYEDS